MQTRSSLLVCAALLSGCGGGRSDSDATDATSSGGMTGSSGSSSTTADGPTTGHASATTGTSDLSTGTGSSGPGTSTSSSSGDEPSTGPVMTTSMTTAMTTGTSTTDGTTDDPAEPAPDWALEDVNPNSASYQQQVARSGYAGKVSGWYFAHAT